MNQIEQSAIERLDRMFPILYGAPGHGVTGLGQFIRHIFLNSEVPEMDAETIAIAVIKAFDLLEEADTI